MDLRDRSPRAHRQTRDVARLRLQRVESLLRLLLHRLIMAESPQKQLQHLIRLADLLLLHCCSVSTHLAAW